MGTPDLCPTRITTGSSASCSALLRTSLTAKDDNKTTLWWIWMRWRSAVLPQIIAQLALLQAALHYKQRAQDCLSRQGKWEGSGKNSLPSQSGDGLRCPQGDPLDDGSRFPPCCDGKVSSRAHYPPS